MGQPNLRTVQECQTNYSRRPISLPSTSRAFSCPNPSTNLSYGLSPSFVSVDSSPELNKNKFKGRFLKRLRPKHKNDFSAGIVTSWRDFTQTKLYPVKSSINSTQMFTTPSFQTMITRFRLGGGFLASSRNNKNVGVGDRNLSTRKPEWRVYTRRKQEAPQKMDIEDERIPCRKLEVLRDYLGLEDQNS